MSMTKEQRTKARRAAVNAAWLAYGHKERVHYTQGAQRWEGIADTRYSARKEYPNNADCSAFATWCIWNGLYVLYKKPDVVNGAGWKAGYTGTMLDHGRPIRQLSNVRWADCVIYGVPGNSKHTAIIVGLHNRQLMVISHGSEGGPYYLPYNYRSDVLSIRRYIHYKS
jgi:hypothetical protein